MYWYVLTHPNPAQIEWMLQRENLGGFCRDGEPVPEPLEYFIPFQFLLRAPTQPVPGSVTEDYADREVMDLVAEEDNGIREALHSYIFIHSNEQRIEFLLNREWNRNGRLHLYQYRTTDGTPLRVLDDEMRRFIDTLRNRQLRYYIGQPVDAMKVGDTVTLRIAPWQGRKATVTRVEIRGGKTKLTVTLDILGNLTRVTFPDVREGDVTFDDETMGRLLKGNMLGNFEDEMVAILNQRFGHSLSDEERRRVFTRLSRLYGYRSVAIDEPDIQRRFTALMLICASLIGDKENKQQYVKQLKCWLDRIYEPTTDTEAYLVLALFVAQRDPALREALKAYKNTHECPAILLRLFSKAKRLRCR